MQYWLMKSEPDCYSIDDLKKRKKGFWDGVRNYRVRNMIRDDMKAGDMALFYHSSAGAETGVAGVMDITSNGYPDPTQFDPKSEHPDPTATPEHPRWYGVDVSFKSKFSKVVYLADLRLDPTFSGMALLQKGNRLSIMPVSKKHFEKIVAMGAA